jgi:hypothetical protein
MFSNIKEFGELSTTETFPVREKRKEKYTWQLNIVSQETDHIRECYVKAS